MSSDKHRIVIIMHNDLMHYPPMISLIDILNDLGEEVVFIGEFTSSPTVDRFKENGVRFIELGYERVGSQLNKFKVQRNYRKNLSTILAKEVSPSRDLIWYVYSDSANFLHDLLAKYKYIIHYFEYERQTYSWKYRFMYPSYSQESFAKKAVAIVQCEYNRASIYRGMNGLDRTPFVLPNKAYVKEEALCEDDIPDDSRSIIFELRDKLKNKKIILYQGIFDSNERKLEEFCQAINIMSDEYVLVAMGRGDKSFDELKKKYESERILFVPFILPPYHLFVTQLASIGVLTYSPFSKTYAGVINPLYCAPNKIFEYGRYGVPMISNDIPGLKSIFDTYHCGKVVEYPITPEKIREGICQIFSDYSSYVVGSKSYYNSIDVVEIVKHIIAFCLRK